MEICQSVFSNLKQTLIFKKPYFKDGGKLPDFHQYIWSPQPAATIWVLSSVVRSTVLAFVAVTFVSTAAASDAGSPGADACRAADGPESWHTGAFQGREEPRELPTTDFTHGLRRVAAECELSRGRGPRPRTRIALCYCAPLSPALPGHARSLTGACGLPSCG